MKVNSLGLRLILFWGTLLCATLAGWGKQARRVLVVHSYEDSYAEYPQFNRLIADAFKMKEINAELRFFYLDCESFREDEEIGRIYSMLDSLSVWKPEIILVNEDQATYSLLKSEHPLVKTLPVVFAGVNYPNWKLIDRYPNVTGFHDKIDIVRNIEMAKHLFGTDIGIFTVLDSTFIDRKIKADVREQLKDQKVCGLGRPVNSLEERRKLLAEGYTFFNAIAVRNSRHADLIWNLSKFRDARTYIQLKRDFTTINVSNLNAGSSLTAINDGFGSGEKFLGGYMTTLETQVEEAVDAAVRIMNGAEVSSIPIRESHKDYVMDWKVMEQSGLELNKVPTSYHIINIPFNKKYHSLWLSMVLIMTILILAIMSRLLFLYRREQQRKKKAQYDLAAKKEALELAIEGSSTYAWQLEDDYIVFETAFWNSLGVPEKELTIEGLISLSHPDDRDYIREDWKDHLSAKKRIAQVRCDFNGKGYQWWEFRYTTTRLATGSYRTAGLSLSIQDVKDKEYELEEARRLAEKAELKESFLTNMSHEIRTPLNAIVGFTNVITTDESLSAEEKSEYVEIINMNTELLLKLINDILELSRLDSGHMSFEYTACKVDELVNDIYQTHRVLVPSNLQFLKEIPSDVPSPQIRVDRGRVTQVLTNFLNNACKFTAEGYIKIGCLYAKDMSEVHIYVEDSGKGISVEEQKIIFSRFYKQDEFAQGAGLGLSICEAIIEKLGGRIELHSEVSKGSRFSIILPCQN